MFMFNTIGTQWPSFIPNFYEIKVTMKVYSQNIGKILAKINIYENIYPDFIINFINILTKNNKIQQSLCTIFFLNLYLIWLNFEN